MKKGFLKLLGMCSAAVVLGLALLIGFLNLIELLYQWLYGGEAVWLVASGLNPAPWAVIRYSRSADYCCYRIDDMCGRSFLVQSFYT